MAYSLTFQVETIATLQSAEAAPLLELHWREVAEEQDAFELDPDWPTYEKAERAGVLMVMTARRGAVLVGYFMAMVHPHPHYRKVIVASEDIHFLHPDERGKGNGKGMIAAALDALRARGASYVTTREKVAHSHAGIWTALGFRPLDTTYILKL